MILIITDSLDPTANAVIAGLNRQGVPWARFNWADFPERIQVDFDPDLQGLRGIIDESGDLADLDAVATVWIWHPQPFSPPPRQGPG